jgi:tRNA pseudouridine55 synthase
MPEGEASGFLLIDKSEGPSSFDVIRHLRKITGIRKIGHCGTLDPFATGLLVCATGDFTRLLPYLEAQDKSYRATLALGLKTDSGDLTGKVIETSPAEPDPDRLQTLADEISRLRLLHVPLYSAVKIEGKRAYSYARQNIEFELPPRETRISGFALENIAPPLITYSCTVSKGTYIRSLSEYIAGYLGCVGHTVELRRTAIGPVSVDDARPLADLETDQTDQFWFPALRLLAHLPSLHVHETALGALGKGNPYPDPGPDEDDILILDKASRIRGIAYRKGQLLRPKLNFPGITP